MLRALLTERFGLKTHGETRQLPVYTLERVKPTRSVPQMKPSGTDCAPLDVSVRAGVRHRRRLRPRRRSQGRHWGQASAWPQCPTMFFPGGMSLRSMTCRRSPSPWNASSDGPVIDRTELAGYFDFDLTYAPDIRGARRLDGPAAHADAAAPLRC